MNILHDDIRIDPTEKPAQKLLRNSVANILGVPLSESFAKKDCDNTFDESVLGYKTEH